MPEPTIGPPQPNPTPEQAVAHVLFTAFVNRCEDYELGASHELYGQDTDARACDWLLCHSPLDGEETHALVGALRLLDPDRFGRFKLARPIGT